MQDLPDAPEPGSPGLARLCEVLVILLILAMAALQQIGGALGGGDAAGRNEPLLTAPDGQFDLTAKIGCKIAFMVEQDPQWSPLQKQVRDIGDGLRDQVETMSAADRLRLAIVLAELEGPAAGLEAIDELAAEIEGEPAPSRTGEQADIREDIPAMRDAIDGVLPDPATQDRLRERYEWYGRLALVLHESNADPRRQELLGNGMLLFLLIGGFLVIAVSALVAGFALLIVALVKLSNRSLRFRFVPRPPGGSVLIETMVVFVGGFILLKMATGLLSLVMDVEVALWVGLLLQWVMALCILWPAVRGLPVRRALHDLGLHRGRGVIREIGCGIVGYLACLPLLLVGAVVSLVLIFLYGLIARMVFGTPAPQPHNPLVDLVGAADPWVLVLFITLASLWAPLVEEAMFRGALYGHLRSRWHWLPTAVVVALAFGLMHGYMILQLGPVIALGFGFALLREWRGSLIASMTAHCIHNASIVTLLVTMMSLLD